MICIMVEKLRSLDLTYNVIVHNIEGVEGGGEAAAPFVGLAPCETDTAVYDRCTIRINGGSPLQESEGSKSYIICFTCW